MKGLKYILLYCPVVLVSIMGFYYYGIGLFDWVGIKYVGSEYEVDVFRELYRMVNTGLVPICFMSLILIISSEKRKQDIFFRVQAWFMLLFFNLSKLIDHLLSVRNVYNQKEGVNAYAYDPVIIFTLIIGYILACYFRIKHLKKQGYV